MRNQGLIIIGGILIVAGGLLLLSNVFGINIRIPFWPLLLIALGLFMLARPRTVAPGTATRFALIGDQDRVGEWAVAPEEHWFLINDIDIDLTRADVPKGDTRIRLTGFISEAEITIPTGVGLAIHSAAAVTSIDEVGQEEEEHLFSPADWESPDYATAERRVQVDATAFISEIKIRRV